MGSAVLAMAVLLVACGGSSSGGGESAGEYEVAVTGASFPARQFIGETSLMKVGVENTGEKTVPDLTVTVNIEGRKGERARLPFAVHDPAPGLADGDRPVWVLAETYPRLAGSSEPGGAETAAAKTYSFGPLRPGRSVDAVWKLSASRAGKYTIGYEVGAGLGGEAKAETASGVTPGGSFVTRITTALPDTEVNGAGEIVEIKHPR